MAREVTGQKELGEYGFYIFILKSDICIFTVIANTGSKNVCIDSLFGVWCPAIESSFYIEKQKAELQYSTYLFLTM